MKISNTTFTVGAIALPLLLLASTSQAQFFGSVPSEESIQSMGEAVERERNKEKLNKAIEDGTFSTIAGAADTRFNPPGITINFPVSMQGLNPSIQAVRFHCQAEVPNEYGRSFYHGYTDFIPLDSSGNLVSTLSVTININKSAEELANSAKYSCEADKFSLSESYSAGMYDADPYSSPLVDQVQSTLAISGDLKPDVPNFKAQGPSINSGSNFKKR